jgi:hypothetical protein
MIVERIKLPHHDSEDAHHSCMSQLAWSNIAPRTPVSDLLYLAGSLHCEFRLSVFTYLHLSIESSSGLIVEKVAHGIIQISLHNSVALDLLLW